MRPHVKDTIRTPNLDVWKPDSLLKRPVSSPYIRVRNMTENKRLAIYDCQFLFLSEFSLGKQQLRQPQ